MLEIEVDGVRVPNETMHLYAIRFVQVPGEEPELTLYRNGQHVIQAWTLKADVTMPAELKNASTNCAP
jgi:hypothetical protein